MADDPPDLIVLPEAALTGYFLEGAVYDLALPAARFASDLAEAWRGACAGRAVDIAAGFYENDAGTYYNSAIYLHVAPDGERILHLHRKMFLPTYGVFDENLGIATRGTFIIDKNGVVRWKVVNPVPQARDIAEYQKALAELD